MRLPWQSPVSPEAAPATRRRPPSRRRNHLSTAELRRLFELVDAGLHNVDIEKALGVSRWTVWRRKRSLEEERARERIEQQQAQMQRTVVEKFAQRIESGELRATLLGLASLPRKVRLGVLASAGAQLDVHVADLREFNRFIERWSQEQHERAVRQLRLNGTASSDPTSGAGSESSAPAKTRGDTSAGPSSSS